MWMLIIKPDLNLNTSAPKLNAGLSGPDIDLNGPNADFKLPKTDFTLPDIDKPSGKFKMPTLKMPKFGVSGPK